MEMENDKAVVTTSTLAGMNLTNNKYGQLKPNCTPQRLMNVHITGKHCLRL